MPRPAELPIYRLSGIALLFLVSSVALPVLSRFAAQVCLGVGRPRSFFSRGHFGGAVPGAQGLGWRLPLRFITQNLDLRPKPHDLPFPGSMVGRVKQDGGFHPLFAINAGFAAFANGFIEILY